MSDNKILFLSQNDIKNVLSMKEAIDLMKIAFSQISQERVNTPLRTHLPISKHKADILLMPAHSEEGDLVSLKLVSVFKDNSKFNLPLIHALVILVDGSNGKPLAVIDGEYITALRTGAASGLATNLLARANSSAVGIIGSGVQGKSQLTAICEVRAISKVVIVDKSPDVAKSLMEYAKNDLHLDVNITPGADQLSDCDIICTATTSPVPVFSDNDLKPGLHINAIGAYQPDKREIPGKTIKRSKVVVDQRSACLEEAGDLIIPINEKLIRMDHIYAELGEIVLGQKSGRSDDLETTIFKSVGNAAQDLVMAGAIYEKAQKLGIGTTVAL